MIVIKSSNFSKFSCPRYSGQISFHLVISKLMELHRISMLIFSNYGNQQILGQNLSKKFMNDKYFEKSTHQSRNKDITNKSLYQISVNFENIGFWDQIWPKLY